MRMRGRSVSLALAQCGAKTAAVGSAREAMRMLPEFKPDVLVSDIGMPGEDGNDFIRRLRSLGATTIADIPAVALTGYADPEDQRPRADCGIPEVRAEAGRSGRARGGGPTARRAPSGLTRPYDSSARESSADCARCSLSCAASSCVAAFAAFACAASRALLAAAAARFASASAASAC